MQILVPKTLQTPYLVPLNSFQFLELLDFVGFQEFDSDQSKPVF